MPRRIEPMTDTQVAALDRPGRNAVGGVSGLALRITANGARSWVLRTKAGDRQREYGLGSYPTVTVDQARQRARLKLNQLWIEGDNR